MYNNGFPTENQLYYPQSNENNVEVLKNTCKQLQDYYVIGYMNNGSQIEGIIEGFDNEGVSMLVPEEVDPVEDRQFGGYGRRRFRRFRRQRFPFFFFAFPFFRPYPYYYPYY